SFLQDKKHDNGKGQLPLSGEILLAHAMARQELGIMQSAAQAFDQFEEIRCKIGDNGSHPQNKKASRGGVQDKYFMISILHLNSRPVPPGPLPQGEGDPVGYATTIVASPVGVCLENHVQDENTAAGQRRSLALRERAGVRGL